MTLALTVDEGGRLRPVLPALASIMGPEAFGLALFETDADGVVRKLTPSFSNSGPDTGSEDGS